MPYKRGKPISPRCLDLVDRVRCCDDGMTRQEIEDSMGISRHTAKDYIARCRAAGLLIKGGQGFGWKWFAADKGRPNNKPTIDGGLKIRHVVIPADKAKPLGRVGPSSVFDYASTI